MSQVLIQESSADQLPLEGTVTIDGCRGVCEHQQDAPVVIDRPDHHDGLNADQEGAEHEDQLPHRKSQDAGACPELCPSAKRRPTLISVERHTLPRVQQSIMRAFPDALDLLLICVESGMSVEAAFQRVAAEIGVQSSELAEEFGPELKVWVDGYDDEPGYYEVPNTSDKLIEALAPIVGRLAFAEAALRIIKLQSRRGRPRRILADEDCALLVFETEDEAGTDIERLLRDIDEPSTVPSGNDIAFDVDFGRGKSECAPDGGTGTFGGKRQRHRKYADATGIARHQLGPRVRRRRHLHYAVAGDRDRDAVDLGCATPLPR